MKRLLKMVFITLIITGCNNDNDGIKEICLVDNPLEELMWLKEIKTTFAQVTNSVRQEIYEYEYKGQRVFLINDCVGCNDSMAVIYNCAGNKICEIGGLGGQNTCPDFFDVANKKQLLWPNENGLVISKSYYDSVETSNYEIVSVSLTGNILTIEVSSGGCSGSSWIAKLVDSECVLETNPPKRLLKLELQNEEICLAIVRKEIQFDISELQVVGLNQLDLEIEKWNQEIEYNY
ncbi:DUF6970 domain-containing protein [Tenacibaculum amylolyticum]|uniref:DUF6970 domain-containing protein n=1 Tax=Tenacibaculum amylolyticum TaxID=104269 RepID=UPI003893957F